MYFIKKIDIDDGHKYQNSTLVAHTNKQISHARTLLEETVRTFVQDECGKGAMDKFKIIDIHSIDQVNEPLIDSMLVYRLENNPHCILVYQKKTIATKIKGWWSETDTIEAKFRLRCYFELEEYANLNYDVSTNHKIITDDKEMVSSGPSGVKIPKIMTEAPHSMLLDELKNHKKYVAANMMASSRFFKTTITKTKTITSEPIDPVSLVDVVIDPMPICKNVPKPPPPMLMPRVIRKVDGKIDDEKIDDEKIDEKVDEKVDDEKVEIKFYGITNEVHEKFVKDISEKSYKDSSMIYKSLVPETIEKANILEPSDLSYTESSTSSTSESLSNSYTDSSCESNDELPPLVSGTNNDTLPDKCEASDSSYSESLSGSYTDSSNDSDDELATLIPSAVFNPASTKEDEKNELDKLLEELTQAAFIPSAVFNPAFTKEDENELDKLLEELTQAALV